MSMKIVPIGLPLTSAQACVFPQQRLFLGEIGKYASWRYLARGYLHQPELTAENLSQSF
jgi:hypothetical protein